jgi:hypothetical protein
MGLLFALALLLLATPAWAATRCMTYEEKTLGRLYTVCDDGTRATSYWNRTLESWETTVTESPKSSPCTGRMNPITKQVEVRCR